MLKLNVPLNTIMLSEDRKEIVNFDNVQSIKIIDCDEGFKICAVFGAYDVPLQRYDTEEEAQHGLLDLLKKMTKEELHI